MTTVSNDQFRAYLETFHATYGRKIAEYIPPEYRDHLLRLKHLRESSGDPTRSETAAMEVVYDRWLHCFQCRIIFRLVRTG
jgi:hypothetical protein